MSRYPAIPDFDQTPESMANAIRALKDVVEQLAALRQGEAISPKVFWQGNPPEPVKNQLRGGDLWANPENRRLHYWSAPSLTWLPFLSGGRVSDSGGVIAGQYYDHARNGTAATTLAGAANRIDLAPFYSNANMPIDRLGVAVSTGVAAAQVKIVIYGSEGGWPSTLLYETAALSAATTNTMAEETLSFTFLADTVYWLGVRHSSTATLRAINIAGTPSLGLTTAQAAQYATVLRRTVTFASAPPSPWGFLSADRVANTPPTSIRFRAT